MDLWVPADAFARICEAADSGLPFENGGGLFGYHAPGAIVVTDWRVASGNVRRSAARVDFDYVHDGEVADRIFRDSGGKDYWLGDWHTHPGGPCCQSALDREALRRCNDALASFGPAVQMILAGFRGAWSSGAWASDNRPVGAIRLF